DGFSQDFGHGFAGAPRHAAPAPTRSAPDPDAVRMTGRGSAARFPSAMSQLRAPLIGFSAILMWSFLALLTVASGHVPPFQLAAMTFAIGGAVGAASWLFRRGAAAALRQRAEVWALGIGGLFGYHALYFSSMRLAPPAGAGLVHHFLPLLLLLLFPPLPHYRPPLPPSLPPPP